ncbi:MAG: hypothetical protein C0501_12135 [Isosphaera sp.]|nr:hypothetical protein [Isosphaera sp.]
MRVASKLSASVWGRVRVPGWAWFPAGLAAYLALVVLIRASLSRSLMADESEQFALSQVLALGYGAQSPLIIWLVWAAVGVFGPSAAAVVGVRVAALGLMYAGLYALGRVLTPTRGRAALCAAAALLVPVVCWDFVVDKMHTPITAAAAAFTVAALVRAVRGGGAGWAAAVGGLAGLGVLAKYTFVPFAAGLAVACLTVGPYRRWLLSRRGALAAVVAAAVVAPHAAWALANRGAVSGVVTDALTKRPGHPAVAMLIGAADVAVGSFASVLAVFGMAAPAVFRRQSSAPPEVRLLGRAVGLGCLAAVAAVAAAGGHQLRAHWFTPVAVLLPVFLVARLDRAAVPRWRVAALWGWVGVVVVGITGWAAVLAATDWTKPGEWFRARDRFAADAAALLADRPDFVVCDAVRDAGNYRLASPGSTVAVLGTPPAARPAVRGPVAVFVWELKDPGARREDPVAALAREYGLRPDGPVRVSREPAPGEPPCRRVAAVRVVPVDGR